MILVTISTIVLYDIQYNRRVDNKTNSDINAQVLKLGNVNFLVAPSNFRRSLVITIPICLIRVI